MTPARKNQAFVRGAPRIAPTVTDEPSAWRVCAIVPTYNNPNTIAEVVERLRSHVRDVFVIDDGSDAAGKNACADLSRAGVATVFRREVNGGKGAAVKCGLRAANDHGFTHALQIDADGQHDIEAIPELLAASRQQPESLVLASPRFDRSAPLSRRIGRLITTFWVRIESGDAIDDAMCGLRVYPIVDALAANATGDAMDFDPEVAVRMVWRGTPVINVPARVRYVSAEEGGVSHFRLFRDNLLLSWLHFRLTVRLVFSRVFRSRLALSDGPADRAPAALGSGLRKRPVGKHGGHVV